MKNKVYEKKENLTINKIQATQISDTLTIVSEEIPTAETFSLGFFYDVGSRDEESFESGISHFIEHCAFRRTKRFSSRQIASRFESLGAYANAYTTQESTSYYVRALKQHFLPTFKLLNDITRNTIFDSRDTEKERQIILEEIKSYDDDPEESIFDYGDKLIFGEHPMGGTILGTEETLSAIQPHHLIAYHDKFYRHGKLYVCIAGPHPHQYILEKSRQYISDFNAGNIPYQRIAPPFLLPESIEVEKSVSQSHLLMGARVPEYQDDKKYALPVFNILFGDGMSSRLYQNLRDRHGIAYSIYSTLQIHSDCGVLYIYAASDKNKLKKTEKLITEEIDKFLNSPLRNSELQRGKEQLKSSIIIEQESLSARMQSIAKSAMLKIDFEDIPKTIEEIDSLSANEIKEIISEYVSPAKLSTVRIIATG